MGFASGTMTFKRFFVAGQLLEGADESLLERLAAHAITRDALQTAVRGGPRADADSHGLHAAASSELIHSQRELFDESRPGSLECRQTVRLNPS